MSDVLKPYSPSEKGRELIALLFPLSYGDREKKLLEYYKQYPQEKSALADGFHFIIQEVIESRQAGMSDDMIDFPEGIVEHIIARMKADKNYFSYGNPEDFFNIVGKVYPPVFKDYSQIERLIKKILKPESADKPASSLPADYTEEIERKFKEVCKAAELAYSELSRIQRSLINSQKIMDSYNDVSVDISLIEVKLAKETFLDTKKVFLSNGKTIADGMKFVYEVYQQYPDQLQVKKAYITYLSKLLSSREARYPPENYVLNLAKGNFDFSLPDFEPTDRQLQQGKTKYSIKREYEQTLIKDINRLEARYRKRKLTAMLKTNISKAKIISELHQVLKLDPGDIKTHIFLAKLMSDYAKAITDHGKRGVFREQALSHCQAAFSKIDDYLTLQSIKEMKERDIARTSFVKTISAIRIPLIKKS